MLAICCSLSVARYHNFWYHNFWYLDVVTKVCYESLISESCERSPARPPAPGFLFGQSTASGKAEPMQPAWRKRLRAQEQRRNETHTHYLWRDAGESLEHVRERFRRWSSWDAPMRTTITSSFAGSGDGDVGCPESLVISLLFPCSSLFRILPFRQMSLFILTFLQILAVAPPPLQGFTGRGSQWNTVSRPNTDHGLANLL